jgi:hypothetical protein
MAFPVQPAQPVPAPLLASSPHLPPCTALLFPLQFPMDRGGASQTELDSLEFQVGGCRGSEVSRWGAGRGFKAEHFKGSRL